MSAAAAIFNETSKDSPPDLFNHQLSFRATGGAARGISLFINKRFAFNEMLLHTYILSIRKPIILGFLFIILCNLHEM